MLHGVKEVVRGVERGQPTGPEVLIQGKKETGFNLRDLV